MRTFTALRARLSRRTVGLVAVAVVAAIAVASAAPTVARGIEGSMASTIFVDAETELEEARNEVIAAQLEFFEAGQRSAKTFDQFGAFAELVSPSMMSDKAPFESLARARVDLKDVAKLRNAGEGRSRGMSLGVEPQPLATFIPATNDGMLTVAEKNRDLARDYRDHAKLLRDLVEKLDQQEQAVASAAEETLHSIATWCTEIGASAVRKSDATEFDTMLTAVAHLSDESISPMDRLTAFNNAYRQAQLNHDSNLEAERAEAKRLADAESAKKAELDQIKSDTDRLKQLAADRKAAEKAQQEAEEAKRKAEEEKSKNGQPTPTRTPTPTPTPAPTPTQIPSPSPTPTR